MKLRFLFILAITQFMAVSAQLKEFSLDNLIDPENKGLQTLLNVWKGGHK